MILQTQRLTLRLLEMGDVEAMHALMSDAEIMAFWDVPEIDDIRPDREPSLKRRCATWTSAGRSTGR